MVLPGTKSSVHSKLGKCRMWAFHAQNGWYVRPAMNHYRWYTVVMEDITSKRTSDAVRLKYHAVTVPQITPTERIVQATAQLIQAVKNVPSDSPSDYLQTVKQLCVILIPDHVAKEDTCACPPTQASQNITPVVNPTKAITPKTLPGQILLEPNKQPVYVTNTDDDK
eukprot:728789-Ditylum_brightwellii.AAC.1